MKTFTSPTPYIAQVKEELKSYFATGAVDDLLFPIWINDALGKLRKSAYPIYETLVEIENFMGELPCDFNSVKAVWNTCNITTNPILNQGSFYEQVDCRLAHFDDRCHECFESDECTTLNPDYAVVIKHTGVTWFTYKFNHLLRPATTHTIRKCGEHCDNMHSECDDTFDIRDNKISVSFRHGKVHLMYYSNQLNDEGEQLVPDDSFTKNYIIDFLKYKVFQSLYNTTTDESVNIIERKLAKAEADMYQSLIIAQTEFKKLTQGQMVDKANQRKRRFTNYKRTLR